MTAVDGRSQKRNARGHAAAADLQVQADRVGLTVDYSFAWDTLNVRRPDRSVLFFGQRPQVEAFLKGVIFGQTDPWIQGQKGTS